MFRKALLGLAAVILCCSSADAFGLKSHLWIADQVHADLFDDCAVDIRGQSFVVEGNTCAAIRDNKGAFMAGALGPDAFPDLLVGQTIVHPGVDGGRQANEWLKQLLSAARNPDEVAFAWGYAMHYAGDSFAHSYVNNYAGDVFDLLKGGRPGVERRHFLLEKYIDQQLPYRFEWRTLQVPHEFLARQLVLFPYSTNGAASRRAGIHLQSMLWALEAARTAHDKAKAETTNADAKALARRDDLADLEQRLGIPASDGTPYDRRAEAIRKLASKQRRELELAHYLYREAVVTARNQRSFETFTREWAADIEIVARHYVEASLRFAQNMSRQALGERTPYAEQDTFGPYREWYQCYVPVVLGDPVRVGEEQCARLGRLGGPLDTRDAALRSLLKGPAKAAYVTIVGIDRQFRSLLRTSALDLLGMSRSETAKLVREIVDPATVDAFTLNEAFRESANGQLAFKCVIDWIDADLGLRDAAPDYTDKGCDNEARAARMDPQQFKPLAYAVVLAKASLLDQAGARDLVSRFGGDPAEPRLGDHQPYSMLIDSIRSIDGSQQWSTASMPPPRSQPYGKAPEQRAGWGLPGEPFPGFPLYQTAKLRAGPFTALFPEPFEGAILKRAEMRPPHYPFVPCPGDPLRPRGGTVQIGRC